MKAMEDYKKRFEELDIQDDSGIYQRVKELYEHIAECIAAIVTATNSRNEAQIIAAIEDLQ